MKPCDCKDEMDVAKLKEQGISFNENSIIVKPNVVVLSNGSYNVKINQALFEKYARWYLEEQDNEFFNDN